jgi:Velvet factor
MPWDIKIRQSPLQARMQGVTSCKAQRLLDPPLIIEIDTDSERVDASSYICTLSLISNSTPADIFLSEDSAILPNLIGSKSQSAVLFFDDSVADKKKLFFIMPHLSIRLAGEYQLVCRIFNVQE